MACRATIASTLHGSDELSMAISEVKQDISSAIVDAFKRNVAWKYR
jgi:hypothetical protein